MARRKREELEERLISEWLAYIHPSAQHKLRVRVGPLPPEAEGLTELGISPYLYTGVRHWADAIVIYPDRVILIEGKFKLRSDVLGQILINYELFQESPEYQDILGRPIELQVLYAIDDPETRKALERRGIKVTQYLPPWAEKAYAERIRK